ncbi:MAG: Coenzyme F420 hydrogenase/dehydrogenase, beta subunit C-terminal domain, partial [Hyphomicrobiaceae bacterium]
GEISDAVVDTIYDVCPGTRIEGLPECELEDDTKMDNVWGPWRRIVLSWAADPDIRHEGSTGGVLTALAIYLLASGRVKFILHARASATEPSFGERHLSFTEADVIDGAGSRYGPTATLIDVNAVLDRGEPFAFIGKPCDIAALRNHARHDARVDELVRYYLTPVCGGFMEPAGMTAFLERSGIEPDDVTALRYRGRGCPGPTRIETGETATEFHYLDMWGEDQSTWNLPWRCKICPDGIGEAADLAASDTWPGGSPDRITSETDPGANAIVARTARGQELIEAAEHDGALAFGYDITPDDMSIYQPHQMRKKYAAWSRHQGIADAGRIQPQTQRLRIRELSAELPDHTTRRQRDGAHQRIRIGKASEPAPESAE